MSENAANGQRDMDFHHPFTPYPIQQQLMQAIYECIDQGKVGIFESPTGTGKSLSLLCASLTWLRDKKRAAFNDIAPRGPLADDEPDWVREHAKKVQRQELLHRRSTLEAKLEAVRLKEERIRRAEKTSQGHPRKRVKTEHSPPQDDDEAQYLLDDYDSDGDGGGRARAKGMEDGGLSSETQHLLRRLGLAKDDHAADDDGLSDGTKVFICSRTHSQLSQLVGELRRISIPSAFPANEDRNTKDGVDSFPAEPIKQLSLGSRKNLCINPSVASSPGSTINERCLSLQDRKTPADKRCPFVPTKDNESQSLDFKHHALARNSDIEDLAVLGRRLGICPYYASRPAIADSEMVTLPYPLLLQKSARDALGLDLTGHVVVIDEAHNIIDAVRGIHTVELSLAQLLLAREQLMAYLLKFKARLKGGNRVHLAQVVRVLDSLKGYLESLSGRRESEGEVSAGDLLKGRGVDQINIYKLGEYLRTSKLARKVQGYTAFSLAATAATGTATAPTTSDATPALTHVESFLPTLTNPSSEGRFFYTISPLPQDTKLRYLLLDPSPHFAEIISSARTVILLGGTMSPLSDFPLQLFPSLPPSRITTLSCDHVIPPSNLFVAAVPTGADGVPMDFTFAKRNDHRTLDALGQTILALVHGVPDGMVVFFPSYGYLETVLARWDRTGLRRQLHACKDVFVDARGGDADALLRGYSGAIVGPDPGRGGAASGTGSTSERPPGPGPGRRDGALLLSVIGGRLSEGINFSDALGRCVVVVGMPYPNPASAEWRARLAFVEARRVAGGRDAAGAERSGGVARDYADNTTMRAVNQAVGRAVRHERDWAAIVLLDRRYCLPRIGARLPAWIRKSLRPEEGFEGVKRGMKGFFEGKRGGGE